MAADYVGFHVVVLTKLHPRTDCVKVVLEVNELEAEVVVAELSMAEMFEGGTDENSAAREVLVNQSLEADKPEARSVSVNGMPCEIFSIFSGGHRFRGKVLK